MKIALTLLAAAALPLAPAVAQSLHETHERLSMPAGKSVPLYRPLPRPDCRDAVAARAAAASRAQHAMADATRGSGATCAADPARVAAIRR